MVYLEVLQSLVVNSCSASSDSEADTIKHVLLITAIGEAAESSNVRLGLKLDGRVVSALAWGRTEADCMQAEATSHLQREVSVLLVAHISVVA